MIQIQHTLVSPDLLEKKFVCDLLKCKGACCIHGDAGAPLANDELTIIADILEKVKPFMRKEGIRSIERYGNYTIDGDDEPVTQLIDGKECAYLVFEKRGITKCAFELAYNAAKTPFKKPLSCHLYPVRIMKYKDFAAVNLHTWEICKDAFECGNKLNIKVFQFLKEPLIRKFGSDWYEQLEEADRWENKKPI